MNFCHHLASILPCMLSRLNLLLRIHSTKFNQTWLVWSLIRIVKTKIKSSPVIQFDFYILQKKSEHMLSLKFQGAFSFILLWPHTIACCMWKISLNYLEQAWKCYRLVRSQTSLVDICISMSQTKLRSNHRKVYLALLSKILTKYAKIILSLRKID